MAFSQPDTSAKMEDETPVNPGHVPVHSRRVIFQIMPGQSVSTGCVAIPYPGMNRRVMFAQIRFEFRTLALFFGNKKSRVTGKIKIPMKKQTGRVDPVYGRQSAAIGKPAGQFLIPS